MEVAFSLTLGLLIPHWADSRECRNSNSHRPRGHTVGPTSIDPLDHARMIVHSCLERDYCRAKGIASSEHLTMMRCEFEQYRDGFAVHGVTKPSSGAIDDNWSTTELSTVQWVAFLVCLVLSCTAVCAWHSWMQ
jgi:hypothetical protein